VRHELRRASVSPGFPTWTYQADWQNDRANLVTKVEDSVSDKPKYAETKPQPRAELEESFASEDANIISEALFSAAQHEPDWRRSQAQCLRMLSHESVFVPSAALMALSEIALFRGQLDLDLVLPEMKRLESDPDLGPFVGDALDNIRVANIWRAK
jgi:hypothetical protein